MTHRRFCRKCKSRKISLIELWKDHTIFWDSSASHDEGWLEPGHPYKVEARCESCGHRWTLRGIIQVDESMFPAPATGEGSKTNGME